MKKEVIELTPELVAIVRLLQSLESVDLLAVDMWLRGFKEGTKERPA